MKRKLSMSLVIILVATSFISCDEQEVQVPQEIPVSQEVQEIDPDNTFNQWDSITDDYTVVVDEDNKYFVQEGGIEGQPESDAILVEDFTTTPMPEIFESSDAKAVQTNIPYVPESTIEIDPNAPTEEFNFYKGRNVTSLYSFDVDNCTMAEYKVGMFTDEDPIIKSIVNELNNYTSVKQSSNAYFIITYDGTEFQKEYVFIDESNEILVDGLANLNSSKLQPSWLIHMSEENVTNVEVDNSNNEDTTIESAYAGSLLNALKSKLYVLETNSSSDGHTFKVPNTAFIDEYVRLKINFNNGVYYDLKITSKMLDIYTSDLDKSVTYLIDGSVYEEIKRYI